MATETRNKEIKGEIDLGAVTLSPGMCEGKIWIARENGEGGDFSLEDFVQLVEKFYEERF